SKSLISLSVGFSSSRARASGLAAGKSDLGMRGFQDERSITHRSCNNPRMASNARIMTWFTAGNGSLAGGETLARRPLGMNLLGHEEGQFKRLAGIEARVTIGVVAIRKR